MITFAAQLQIQSTIKMVGPRDENKD